MQSAAQLRSQALRCLELAESAYDERLAAQLLGLSEQLLKEADLAVVREEIQTRRAAIHRAYAAAQAAPNIRQEIKQLRAAIAPENQASDAGQDLPARRRRG